MATIYVLPSQASRQCPGECMSQLTGRSTHVGAQVWNGFIEGAACKFGLGPLQRHACCNDDPQVSIIYCPRYAPCCSLESLAVKSFLTLEEVSQGACCCLHQPAQPAFLRYDLACLESTPFHAPNSQGHPAADAGVPHIAPTSGRGWHISDLKEHQPCAQCTLGSAGHPHA